MDKDKHIVIADSEGYFYCRAVDSVLNYKREQQVCGRGCPCCTGQQDDAAGQFVCCYRDEGMEEKPARLSRGLTRNFTGRMHMRQKRMQASTAKKRKYHILRILSRR